MKLYKVGILGATGAVGREMMKILAERQFPISELRLFASSRSAGKVVEWNGRPVMIQEPSEENFRGLDIVLGAAESDIARLYAPEVVRAGAVFVDNSSAYRMDDDVPLVIPEVNPEDVKLHHGIIASANCSTIITVTAVNALNAISPIRSMVASTYQAVSGAGAGGPVELAEEVEALRTGKPVQPKVFSHQIAYNLIPQIGGEQYEGYTSEEMKMQNEGRKIMHLPDLRVTCTCVYRSCAATPFPSHCALTSPCPSARHAMPSPLRRAAVWSTTSETTSIPCRSTRPIRTLSMSAASVRT